MPLPPLSRSRPRRSNLRFRTTVAQPYRSPKSDTPYMRTPLAAPQTAAARVALVGVLLVSCAPAQGTTTTAPRPATPATTTAARPDTGRPAPGAGALSAPNADPFPSTYAAPTSRPTLIRNVTIMTAAGPTIRNGSVLLARRQDRRGRRDGERAAGRRGHRRARQVRDAGHHRHHSHLGVYAAPGGEALSDGNEATNPVTAHVWAEHSVWPQDPQFPRDLAGGVTTLQVLPGSANLIGGRSVVLKVVPSRTVQGMKFPGAKYGLKMACGENPKRVYAQRGPSTRMGNVAGYRAAWIQAEAYRRRWDKWNADHQGRRAAARPRAARRSPRCCAATSSCTTTAIAPTRWRR